MWFWNQKNKDSLFIIFVILLLSIPAIFSLLKPGFFLSDDGEWMIIRFSAFHQALVDGQFPVRWLGRLNYGYGYPVANFLYPGFMYLAEIPKILGFSFVNSIKIILGVSMAGSAIFSYFWLNKIFNKWGALMGSLFYLYTPYHLFDLYKRGSVGEVLALVIVPFILWQIERKSFFWPSLGIGLLILSHNTLAVLFLPLIILYILLELLISPKKLRLFARYTGILIIGLSISAFFWIPAIFDLRYTHFSQTSVSQWNNYFVNQELIGLGTIIVFLLVLVFFVSRKIKIAKHRLTLLFFIIGVLSLFFSTSLSALLWSILPASFIQFPFRFLSVVTLSASFLAACIISVFPERFKIVASIVILFFLFISSQAFISPTQFFDKGEGFYATNEGTTTVQNEYMPKWVKVLPRERPKEKIEIINEEGIIKDLKIKNNKINFTVILEQDSLIRLNTIYFPGWKAFIDGKEMPISYQNDRGVIELNVAGGIHAIAFTFSETPIRLAADVISLASSVVLFILILKRRYGFL